MGVESTIIVLLVLFMVRRWCLHLRDEEAEIEIIQMSKEPEVEPCEARGCAGLKGD